MKRLPVFTLILMIFLGACQVQSSIPATLGPQAHVEVIGEPIPHDPGAFTEGLLIQDAVLYESTGLEGQSDFRKVELLTGKVLAETPLDPTYFGEGLALLNGRFYQLTWRNEIALVFDAKTLAQIGSFSVSGEGWGLTTDGQTLIRSDGSATLTWHDPSTFAPIKTVQVTLNSQPIAQLNELEYIDGIIYANVFMTDNILRIDPATGQVLTVIDASSLRPDATKTNANGVLNGIAWDPATKSLYLTGKNWSFLYKVKIVDGPVPTVTKQP
ncbi:MAG TPA: glutaminyl-peptide cyclotransferase [Anaerolineaceae bacterium]|nr:glutaminyl-peptide cyclotransferase [Anaerolineaceae bacterium]